MPDRAPSPRLLRSRALVLDVLADQGAATRAQLVARTGLAPSSVAAIATSLVADGLVDETTVAGSGRGRPATVLVAVVPSARVVGIDLGHRHVTVAVADQDATVLAERAEVADVDRHLDDALDLAVRMVRAALHSAGVDVAGVDAVSACLPTTLDAPVATGWAAHAAAELGRRLGVEVRLVNDAAAGLAGEARFGAGRGERDLMYVKVAHGIGAAWQLDGRPYRGSGGRAGEIGHIPMTSVAGAAGRWCRCGNEGCLETLVSVDEVERRLARAGVTRVADAVPGPDTVLSRMLLEDGRLLGRVLADLCTAVDPGVLVVGGELATWALDDAGSPLVRGVAEAVRRYVPPATAAALTVRPAELGGRAGLMGTVALALGRVVDRRGVARPA